MHYPSEIKIFNLGFKRGLAVILRYEINQNVPQYENKNLQ